MFFDIGEPEIGQFIEGQPLTIPLPEGAKLQPHDLDLGNFTWCFACESLESTSAFYCALAFVPAGGAPDQGWAILGRADNIPGLGQRTDAMHLSLFCGMIPKDMLNFRGGNVSAIATQLEARGVDLKEGVTVGKDGGESLMIYDPDERLIFLDTTPPERLY